MVSAAVGRADLVRAFGAQGAGGLARLAGLLGYREQRAPAAVRVEAVVAPVAPEIELAPGTATRPAAMPFWRLEAVEHLERATEVVLPVASVLGMGDVGPPQDAELPKPAAIVPWSRLWPALQPALRSTREGHELDTPKLVERWGRGELLHRLPRRPTFAWSRRVSVWVDRSTRLIPFWADQDALVGQLRRRLGHGGLRVVWRGDGIEPLWRWRRGHGRLPRLEVGETVLTLGDLGFYGGGAERGFWAQLGRWLRRGGVRIRALVPCPAGRWQAQLARLWSAVDWSSPLRTAARRSEPGEAAVLTARAERLLQLVAPAVRVEPGLLRAARRLLPAWQVDVGTEADVWAHPQVKGDSSVALHLEPGFAAQLRQGFRAEPAALKARVAAVLRRWHAPLAREIWHEELLGLALAGELPVGSLAAEELAAAWQFMLRLSRTQIEPESAHAALVRASGSYLLRSGVRLPAEVWRDPVLGEALARGWVAAAVEQPELALPPGVSPSVLDREPGRQPPRRWTAWHEGDRLRFRAEGEQPLEGVGGSPLVTFTAAFPELAIATSREAWATLCQLDPPSPGHPLPRSETLLLSSDHECLELRRFERPPWASAMGRDRFGLWVEVEVRGVRFRMRWISSGRFLMGSPESEAGRWADEGPQHQVTLTRGYWLAETPCTQALWQAVMGENPSRFETRDRPVETVSWEQCEKFFEAIEAVVPGLAVRLPTEAEWEYACRAGTATSTFAGEMEILGANNAPILQEIAWYGGNSGHELDIADGYDSKTWEEKQFEHKKAATRIVKQKLPNAWGLYDMLGNLWEWCADGWSEYSAEPVEDPLAPAVGSERVIRGGSWFSAAGRVRAAARSWSGPGLRDDLVGFRLARGQAAPS